MSKKIDEIRAYWTEKNIPQIWHSAKEPLSLQWFNKISAKRYNKYYTYLTDYTESSDHSGEEALETGIGMGTDLVEFRKNGANVTGVDLGEDQIRFTSLNFALRGYEVPSLEVQNAEELNFPDASFDYVYSFGVHHHTPNTGVAINHAHRVLKEDGHSTIMLYARGWKHYIKRCLIQGILRGKYLRMKSRQAVYNYVSEANGGSPMTYVFAKKGVRQLFSKFDHVEIHKVRMGEFFEYDPYGTVKLPAIFGAIANAFNAQAWFGENYLIKAYKKKNEHTASLKDVIFKHY